MIALQAISHRFDSGLAYKRVLAKAQSYFAFGGPLARQSRQNTGSVWLGPKLSGFCPAATIRRGPSGAREPSDLSLLLKPSCAKDHFMLNFLIRLLAIHFADNHRKSSTLIIIKPAEGWANIIGPRAQRGLYSLLLDNVFVWVQVVPGPKLLVIGSSLQREPITKDEGPKQLMVMGIFDRAAPASDLLTLNRLGFVSS